MALPDSSDPLIIVHQAKDTMSWISKRLFRLAESFSLVGNEKVSETLGTYGNELVKHIVSLTQAEALMIRDQVRLADANSRNVLGAALAGAGRRNDANLGVLVTEDANKPVSEHDTYRAFHPDD